MKKQGFENADIVFITDGECAMTDGYLETLKQEQDSRRFTVTVILLDTGTPGMGFSLKPFCSRIFRSSELAGDEHVLNFISLNPPLLISCRLQTNILAH